MGAELLQIPGHKYQGTHEQKKVANNYIYMIQLQYIAGGNIRFRHNMNVVIPNVRRIQCTGPPN